MLHIKSTNNEQEMDPKFRDAECGTGAIKLLYNETQFVSSNNLYVCPME